MLGMEMMNQRNIGMKKNNSSVTAKTKKMPFEIEESFFEYDSQELPPPGDLENSPLPFEDEDEFFDYEMPEEEHFDKENPAIFPLPFENEEDDDFFEYESQKNNAIQEEKNDGGMLPFEKENGFFKYK